jgi:hypothetical protein
VGAKKDGKAFQLLVRAIESAIAAGNANITIEMSKRFPDKVTGKLREHDVVLTITHAHHQAIVALECRDRSRPVGVEAVEAFHTKCQDTGIHSGIIVSGTGFTATAVEKATRYNIRCLSSEEVESFDWCAATGMETFARQLRGMHLQLNFAEGNAVKQETIRMEDGTPVNNEMIWQWGQKALAQYNPAPREEPGDRRVLLLERNPKLYGIADGKRVQAVEALFSLDYIVSAQFSPFTFRTYKDLGESKQVRQVAICQVLVSNSNVGELVLSPNQEGLITVALVAPPTGPSEK